VFGLFMNDCEFLAGGYAGYVAGEEDIVLLVVVRATE
jgi:hypothetical protein